MRLSHLLLTIFWLAFVALLWVVVLSSSHGHDPVGAFFPLGMMTALGVFLAVQSLQDLRYLRTPLQAQRVYHVRFIDDIDVTLAPIIIEGPAVVCLRTECYGSVTLRGPDAHLVSEEYRHSSGRHHGPPFEDEHWFTEKRRWSIGLNVRLRYPAPNKVRSFLLALPQRGQAQVTTLTLTIRGRCRIIELPPDGELGHVALGFPVITASADPTPSPPPTSPPQYPPTHTS